MRFLRQEDRRRQIEGGAVRWVVHRLPAYGRSGDVSDGMRRSVMDEHDATVIAPGRVRWEVVAGLAALVLALDLATKRMIQNVFVIGEQKDILPFFGLQYHVNDGAAFG